MFKQFFSNLKTTLLGGTAGGAMILQGIEQKQTSLIVTGVLILLSSLFTQDAK